MTPVSDGDRAREIATAITKRGAMIVTPDEARTILAALRDARAEALEEAAGIAKQRADDYAALVRKAPNEVMKYSFEERRAASNRVKECARARAAQIRGAPPATR